MRLKLLLGGRRRGRGRTDFSCHLTALCKAVGGFVLEESEVCWTTGVLLARQPLGTNLLLAGRFVTLQVTSASTCAYNGRCSMSKLPMAPPPHLQTKAARHHASPKELQTRNRLLNQNHTNKLTNPPMCTTRIRHSPSCGHTW